MRADCSIPGSFSRRFIPGARRKHPRGAGPNLHAPDVSYHGITPILSGTPSCMLIMWRTLRFWKAHTHAAPSHTAGVRNTCCAAGTSRRAHTRTIPSRYMRARIDFPSGIP